MQPPRDYKDLPIGAALAQTQEKAPAKAAGASF
jgi:hypothetical protein